MHVYVPTALGPAAAATRGLRVDECRWGNPRALGRTLYNLDFLGSLSQQGCGGQVSGRPGAWYVAAAWTCPFEPQSLACGPGKLPRTLGQRQPGPFQGTRLARGDAHPGRAGSAL